VWQQYHERHTGDGVEVLSVAIDAQGGDKARPYVERASATFTTVVDEENLLSRLYGFKAIPNGLLIDECGVIRYKEFGGFDIREARTADLLERWARGGPWDAPALSAEDEAVTADHARSMMHFQEGLELYRAGRASEAMARWREGVRISPENWVIRKQIWAVEHPDRFYGPSVDYDWQREQVEKGL
jgi:hypothetical protein